MLTQCPKCETVYRVDAAELGAAQGFVECGDCGEQFNALSRLADEPKFHSESTTLPSAVEGTSPQPQTTDRSRHPGPAFVLLDSEEANAAIEHKTIEKPPISAVDLEQLASAATSSTIDFAAVAPPAQTLSESEHAILFTDPQLEFEDDEDDETDAISIEDVPEILKKEFAALNRPQRQGIRWLWTLVAVCLVLSLALQIAWVFRNQIIATHPPALALYRQVCERLGCQVEIAAQTGQIELLARDVRDHPQYRDTLLVNATLVSRSDSASLFPVIQLGLFDRTGTVIGIRRFEPNEYLDKSIDLGGGMPPNRSVYIVLEVAGVGARAVGFEFSFL